MKHLFKFASLALLALVLCAGTLFGVGQIFTASAASETYEIKFISGSDTQTLQTNEDGKLVSLPSNPTSTNTLAEFAGWFASQGETNSLDEKIITQDTVFDKNESFYAKWVYKLEISQAESGYSLSFGGKSYNFTDFSELLSTALNISELKASEALPLRFTLLKELTFTSEVVLGFDTISETSNNFKVFEIFADPSGSSLSFSAGCLKIQSSSDQTINLNGISLSSTSGENLLELAGTGKISLKGMTFNGGNYAVHNSDGASVSFFDDTECTSNYFSNYISGKALTLVGDYTKLKNQLKIVVPYTVYNDMIVRNVPYVSTDDKKVVLVPESDNFTLDCYTTSLPESLVASSNIEVTLKSGDGKFDDEEVTRKLSLEYGALSDSTISAATPSKDMANFVGFVGELKLKEQTYYFDKERLVNFITSGDYNFLNIEKYFVKEAELDTLNIKSENCFTKYHFSSSLTDPDFAVIEIFMRAGAKPTFMAIYESPKYDITFVTNTEISIEPAQLKFGENVNEFLQDYLSGTSLTTEGYKFVGWYLDEECSTQLLDDSYTMPEEAITLYAKWEKKTFTVKFFTGSGETYQEIRTLTVEFDEEIDLTDPVESGYIAEGYEFSGWYVDIAHTQPLQFSKMPDINREELDLYAKLDVRTYKITLNFVNIDRDPHTLPEFEFNSNIPSIDSNLTEVVGYNFLGWFASTDFLREQMVNILGTQMTSEFTNKGIVWRADEQKGHYSTTLYGYFEKKSFKVSFVSNIENLELPDISVKYGEPIIIPNDFKYSNHKLVGWYSDKDFNFAFDLSSMPDLDSDSITLYAKWELKKMVGPVNQNVQTYTLSDFYGYNIGNELSDFKVYYSTDGVNWTTDVPRSVGTYDIKICRAEDADYAEFEIIISSALVLKSPQINLTWLIALLFVLFMVEIVGCVVIRILRNAKKNMVAYSLVPLFSYVIDSSQFVLLIISSILVVFGLVLVIYELVKLHNTVPAYDDTPAKKNKYSQSTHGIEYENDSEPEALKYSAEDIKNMLIDDTYDRQHRKKTATKKQKSNYVDPIVKAKRYGKKFAEKQERDSSEDGPEQKIYGRKTSKVPKQKIEFSDSEELYNIDNFSTKKVRTGDNEKK